MESTTVNGESLNGKPNERFWTMDEFRQTADTWSLANDAGLYHHLVQATNVTIEKSVQTRKAVENLRCTVADAHVEAQNSMNALDMLSNHKFLENLVAEEPPENLETDVATTNGPGNVAPEDMLSVVRQALHFGLKVLHEHYERIDVTTANRRYNNVDLRTNGNVPGDEDDSDGSSLSSLEGEGQPLPQGAVEPIYQPKDPYERRQLPHLIGSKAFLEDDTLGIGYLGNEEEMLDEEVEDEPISEEEAEQAAQRIGYNDDVESSEEEEEESPLSRTGPPLLPSLPMSTAVSQPRPLTTQQHPRGVSMFDNSDESSEDEDVWQLAAKASNSPANADSQPPAPTSTIPSHPMPTKPQDLINRELNKRFSSVGGSFEDGSRSSPSLLPPTPTATGQQAKIQPQTLPSENSEDEDSEEDIFSAKPRIAPVRSSQLPPAAPIQSIGRPHPPFSKTTATLPPQPQPRSTLQNPTPNSKPSPTNSNVISASTLNPAQSARPPIMIPAALPSIFDDDDEDDDWLKPPPKTTATVKTLTNPSKPSATPAMEQPQSRISAVVPPSQSTRGIFSDEEEGEDDLFAALKPNVKTQQPSGTVSAKVAVPAPVTAPVPSSSTVNKAPIASNPSNIASRPSGVKSMLSSDEEEDDLFGSLMSSKKQLSIPPVKTGTAVTNEVAAKTAPPTKPVIAAPTAGKGISNIWSDDEEEGDLFAALGASKKQSTEAKAAPAPDKPPALAQATRTSQSTPQKPKSELAPAPAPTLAVVKSVAKSRDPLAFSFSDEDDDLFSTSTAPVKPTVAVSSTVAKPGTSSLTSSSSNHANATLGTTKKPTKMIDSSDSEDDSLFKPATTKKSDVPPTVPLAKPESPSATHKKDGESVLTGGLDFDSEALLPPISANEKVTPPPPNLFQETAPVVSKAAAPRHERDSTSDDSHTTKNVPIGGIMLFPPPLTGGAAKGKSHSTILDANSFQSELAKRMQKLTSELPRGVARSASPSSASEDESKMGNNKPVTRATIGFPGDAPGLDPFFASSTMSQTIDTQRVASDVNLDLGNKATGGSMLTSDVVMSRATMQKPTRRRPTNVRGRQNNATSSVPEVSSPMDNISKTTDKSNRKLDSQDIDIFSSSDLKKVDEKPIEPPKNEVRKVEVTSAVTISKTPPVNVTDDTDDLFSGPPLGKPNYKPQTVVKKPNVVEDDDDDDLFSPASLKRAEAIKPSEKPLLEGSNMLTNVPPMTVTTSALSSSKPSIASSSTVAKMQKDDEDDIFSIASASGVKNVVTASSSTSSKPTATASITVTTTTTAAKPTATSGKWDEDDIFSDLPLPPSKSSGIKKPGRDNKRTTTNSSAARPPPPLDDIDDIFNIPTASGSSQRTTTTNKPSSAPQK